MNVTENVIVYYRKDASWLARHPLDPPVEDSPDSLVEVGRYIVARYQNGFARWRDPVATLEDAFKKFQNIEDGDLPQKLGIRSMMHGDMVVVGKRAWQCEMVGWREVRPEWFVRGDFPKSFPELKSCHEESSQENAAS